MSEVGSLLRLTVLGSRKLVDDWGAKKNGKFVLRVWELRTSAVFPPVVSSQVRHGYADAELNLDVCGGIQSVGEMVSSFRSSLSG